MNEVERHEYLPSDEHWPATHYTLYSQRLGQGESGRQLCSEHIMAVYRESLIRFYLGCAGLTGFPKLPKRSSQLDDREHAEDIVHEYFAKRAENLIPKWAQYRRSKQGDGPDHLRSFIKQDFRFHCFELLRLDQRYHDRARELSTEQFEAPSMSDELQRETTELELSALVRQAIEATLEGYPESEHAQLRVLAENRILAQRRYQDFDHDLTCSRESARQKVLRFRRKLIPTLRELIREHGDSLSTLLRDLT